MTVATPKHNTGVTWRAILIGLVLIPLNSYWVVQMESICGTGQSTLFTLLFNVVFTILVLIILNAPIKKLLPRIAFNQGELLTIYIMLCQASTLAGHSMMQILPPTMAAPLGLATVENEWKELFWQYIPKWLAVSDGIALKGYVKSAGGESTLYTARHIKAWLMPAMLWSVFICALMFVMMCVNVIIRKQWTDNERLTYPITQLPFEMTDIDKGLRLFKSKLFWASFIFVGVINVINGLHYFLPMLPYLRVRPYNIGALFASRPWNALGYMAVTFRPYLMGLIFLIPRDIIFSCWFFFFFWKAQLILGSFMGWRERPEFPEQTAGAYISLFLMAFWLGRRHLIRIFRTVFSPGKNENSPGYGSAEPLKYKTAVFGLIFGFIFILFFCWKAGMSFWAAGTFFTLYLMTAIGVTRIRAELGSPIHDLHFAGPEVLMVDALGTRRIGPHNLSVISMLWFLTRAHYSDVMPHQLEAFKLADRAKMKGRRVFAAMLIAIVAGTLVAFWVIIHSGYRQSSMVMSWAGLEPFTRLQLWLTQPMSPDVAGMGFFAYGLLFGIFLMSMRARFLWWPFHPAGYALSSSYAMRYWWSIFLLVWFIKRLLLKYGGLRAHRKAFPIFFGMILGEFAIGGFWALLGTILKTQIYNFTAWW